MDLRFEQIWTRTNQPLFICSPFLILLSFYIFLGSFFRLIPIPLPYTPHFPFIYFFTLTPPLQHFFFFAVLVALGLVDVGCLAEY